MGPGDASCGSSCDVGALLFSATLLLGFPSSSRLTTLGAATSARGRGQRSMCSAGYSGNISAPVGHDSPSVPGALRIAGTSVMHPAPPA